MPAELQSCLAMGGDTTLMVWADLDHDMKNDDELREKFWTVAHQAGITQEPFDQVVFVFAKDNVEQKTEVMVEHFRMHVMHRLNGRAKAMLVTSSRLSAVRYKLAFERYIKENAYADIPVLVAFSGTVKDPETGFEYTEPGMNLDVVAGKPIGESQLPERFDSPDYQLLLVANKYQTGACQSVRGASIVFTVGPLNSEPEAMDLLR